MAATTPPHRRTYGIVAIGALSYTWLMFIWFALPAYLSVIIVELSLTGTQAGVVVGAIPAIYIPLALFSGLFVDRIGAGRSLALGVLVFGLAQIGRSSASGFPSLLGFTILIGVGATAVTFGLPKLVSVLFPPDRTGLPSAIYLVAANVGSAAAFAVGRPLIGPRLGGWRPLFFWSGVVAVMFAVGWFGFSTSAGFDRSSSGGDAAVTARTMIADVRLVLSHRELQLLVGVGTMYLFVVHGVQGWLPTILESRGVAAEPAGLTTSGFVAAVVVGIIVVPVVADRFRHRRSVLTVCGVCITIGIGGLLITADIMVTVIAVFLAGFGAGGISPLLRAIPPGLDGIGARLTGTAVGFIFAIGEVGGFLGPVLIGATHQATGSFAPGFAMLVVAGSIVAALGIALARVSGS